MIEIFLTNLVCLFNTWTHCERFVMINKMMCIWWITKIEVFRPKNFKQKNNKQQKLPDKCPNYERSMVYEHLDLVPPSHFVLVQWIQAHRCRWRLAFDRRMMNWQEEVRDCRLNTPDDVCAHFVVVLIHRLRERTKIRRIVSKKFFFEEKKYLGVK